MKNDPKTHRDEYFNFMAGLADSIVNASDEEIEEAIEEEGDNSEEVRGILLGAVKSAKRKLLEDARQGYEASIVSYEKISFELPRTSAEKRGLIQAMLGQMAQGQQGITAQFRDFESLRDEELDGVLFQLMHLQSAKENEE
jgi:hypothetical protein